MSLYTVIGSENIPKGAIRLTRDQAIEFQKQRIKKKSLFEVFFLRCGTYMAGATGLISSYYSVRHFVNYFNVRNAALFIYPIPMIFSVAGTAGVFHYEITRNVMVMDQKCPICRILRCCVAQVAMSVIYPICAGSLASFWSAEKQRPIAQGKEVFRLLFKVSKQGVAKFQTFAGLHLISTMFLSYMQYEELLKMNKEFQKQNYQHDNLNL